MTDVPDGTLEPIWRRAADDPDLLARVAEETLTRDAARPERIEPSPLSPATTPVIANFDSWRAVQAAGEQLAEQAAQHALRMDLLADARSDVRWRSRRRTVLHVVGLGLLVAAATAIAIAILTSGSIRLAAGVFGLVLTGGGSGAIVASRALARQRARRKPKHRAP